MAQPILCDLCKQHEADFLISAIGSDGSTIGVDEPCMVPWLLVMMEERTDAQMRSMIMERWLEMDAPPAEPAKEQPAQGRRKRTTRKAQSQTQPPTAAPAPASTPDAVGADGLDGRS